MREVYITQLSSVGVCVATYPPSGFVLLKGNYNIHFLCLRHVHLVSALLTDNPSPTYRLGGKQNPVAVRRFCDVIITSS